MSEAGHLFQVIVILLAAVLSLLLFQRLGLGSVLGYLAAGTAIGPSAFALIADLEATRELAEFGVVFLLFTVGLELPFERIKLMRGRIFGLGAAQVGVTLVAVAAAASWLGAGAEAALVIGAGLALSSTAIVLRLLSDRGELTSRFGRSAFAVLLIQDFSVGPLLVLILALSRDQEPLGMALAVAGLKVVIAVLAILGIGRIALRQVFWPVAQLRDGELFAALTLLVVLCAAALTRMAGLSMAFGAFLAGMLLAETHYRHQVAAVIQPFRGLLLGLFFMTVGMTIDIGLIVEDAATIGLLLVALLLGKALLLFGLARLFRQPLVEAAQLGILLAQGGEFAFVLLGAGMSGAVLADEIGQRLIVVVALSMALTPLLARLGQYLARQAELAGLVGAEDISGGAEALRDHVVIAGFGRVGSTVASSLSAAGVPFIAVDLDPARIARARQRGLPVFYGDITHAEILAALHVERARSLVIALDDANATRRAVTLVSYIFPQLKIFARARDDEHARELEEMGADIVVPELAATGAQLADSILETPR